MWLPVSENRFRLKQLVQPGSQAGGQAESVCLTSAHCLRHRERERERERERKGEPVLPPACTGTEAHNKSAEFLSTVGRRRRNEEGKLGENKRGAVLYIYIPDTVGFSSRVALGVLSS